MDVSIGRSTESDIDDVVRFIDDQWERGHALATCRPLLDWQHRDADGRGYSFVVARRRQSDQVLGILGYIATRRFDPRLADHSIIWLTTWKVRDDAAVSGLGLMLLAHLARIEPHQAIGALLPRPETTGIYRALGYRVGELGHYVVGNANAETFRLATTVPRAGTSSSQGPPLMTRRLRDDDDFMSLGCGPGEGRVPRKTPEYFRTRYARHPVYSYIVTALLDDGEAVGLLAVRSSEHAGARALRVVDFVGSTNVLARMGPILQNLLDETGAEYADVYNTGIEASVFERAGLLRVDPEGPMVVPDHFEPFERRNVRLWFAFKGPHHPILFKGDADQDRPNRVPRTTA